MHGGFGGNGGDGCLSLLGVGGCVDPSWFSWAQYLVLRGSLTVGWLSGGQSCR